MKKQICALGIFLLLMNSCTRDLLSSSELSQPDENEIVFREKTLEEINFVRTSPSEYAIERLDDQYKSNNDNGAYEDLLTQEEQSPLVLNSQLTLAADKYSQFLATSGGWSHTEDGTPSERCEREGYHSFSGENIAAGSHSHFSIESNPEEAAIQFVVLLIIDEGVEGVGHRKNILGSSHKSVGIGFHYDAQSNYVNYSVQDFGSVE